MVYPCVTGPSPQTAASQQRTLHPHASLPAYAPSTKCVTFWNRVLEGCGSGCAPAASTRYGRAGRACRTKNQVGHIPCQQCFSPSSVPPPLANSLHAQCHAAVGQTCARGAGDRPSAPPAYASTCCRCRGSSGLTPTISDPLSCSPDRSRARCAPYRFWNCGGDRGGAWGTMRLGHGRGGV